MTEQNLQQVLTYLDKIGAKLGVATNTVWPWLVKQQYILAYYSLVILGFGLLLAPLSYYFQNKYQPFENDDLQTSKSFIMCACIVLTILTVAFGILLSLVNAPKLLNPEYYAFTNLLKLLQTIN